MILFRKLVHSTLLVCLLSVSEAASAETPTQSASNIALRTPTEFWLRQQLDLTEKTGDWASLEKTTQSALLKAYEANAKSASHWLSVHQWVRLWATPEREALREWVQSSRESGVAHPAMALDYHFQNLPLAARTPKQLKLELLRNTALSQEFFSLASSYDLPMRSLEILAAIWSRSPEDFHRYSSLAVAIALVYDVRPPASWPHSQVSAQQLPRIFLNPVDAFSFWVRSDKAGKLALSPLKLGASELRFVVDVLSPLNELTWAQDFFSKTERDLSDAYEMVYYREARTIGEGLDWPHSTYTLRDIYGSGGICVDQAFFGTQSGKALGVPTLFFRGTSMEERHAWFGYLNAKRGWVFDCGRRTRGNIAVGSAWNPQTWSEVSEHELLYIAAGEHRLESFHQARFRSQIAAIYLELGRFNEARMACAQAIASEPRSRDAWHMQIEVLEAAKADSLTIEQSLRTASEALKKYPDLSQDFVHKLVARLSRRGAHAEAAYELAQFTARLPSDRNDLALAHVRTELLRTFKNSEKAERLAAFTSALDRYGDASSMQFCDEILKPAIRCLRQAGHTVEAEKILQLTRHKIRPALGSLLEREFALLETEVTSKVTVAIPQIPKATGATR